MAKSEESKLILTAEDRTAAAFRSVESNFKNLEAGYARFSAMAATVVGGTLIGAFGAMIRASEDAAQAQRKLDAMIRATGNTTGYTNDQLSRLADNLARSSTFDDEAYREATATLMRFGNIGGQNLEKVLKLSADYAALTGGDLSSSAEKMGRALSNPAEGLKKLERNFGDLGKETEAAIKLQTDMGNSTRALEIAIEALEKKIGGGDAAMNAGLTGAMKQLKKAAGELLETFGAWTDSPPVVGALDKIAAAMRGLKTVLEGDWTLKAAALLALMNNRGMEHLQAIGNLKPEAIKPGAGAAAPFSLADQDARAIDAQIRRQKQAADEIAEHNKRMRELDARGWVAYIEATSREYEDGLREQAKLTEDFYDARDDIRQLDLEGQEWLAKNVVRITEGENAKVLEAARRLQEDLARIAQENYLRVWDELATRGADFFVDLVFHGREAFKRLGESLKQFAAEMLAIFAKRWILNMGANLTGSPTLSAMAGATGQGTLAGAALNWAGSTIPGVAAGGEFLAGATGTFMGPAMPGSAAAMGQSVYAFLSNPITIGVLAVAAIAVAARARAGGEKEGGSFYGAFDASGRFLGDRGVPGSDNGRLYTPDSGDAFAREAGTGLAQEFFSTLTRLGGSTAGLSFGLGFDRDPRGSADNRVSSMVTDATGRVIYSNTQTGGRDQEDFDRALGLESRRAILAALQASELPQEIADILDNLDPAGASQEDIDRALAAAEAMGRVINSLADLNVPGLDVAALRSFQADGEELEQTFTRVAGLWGRYQDLFLTDAEKLTMVQNQVTETFAGLAITVPASMEDFKRLVDGLDLTTEAGRETWRALMEVAPAFSQVSNAAAGMLSDFDSIMGRMRGSAYTTGQNRAGLEAATREFMAGNAWTSGMDWRYVAEQITTITREDFQAYSAANQNLINRILGYTAEINAAAAPVQDFAGYVESASGAVDDYARSLEQARMSLRDWAIDKVLGGTSALSAEDKYAFALEEYQRAVASGDAGYFKDSADALLNLGRDRFASGTDFTELFQRVMADAERIGGFSLGAGFSSESAASIDQMRAELAAELRLSNRKADQLAAQVKDLTIALRETSKEQTTAVRQSAEATVRAVRSAVESVAR